MMRCIGFGEYKGDCLRTAGTAWTHLWCGRCDKLRRDSLGKQIEEIRKGFAALPADREGE